MEKSTVVIIAAVILLMNNICLGTPVSADNGLIPPPAINIPYGGTIVTEINLSDNDILGIIKQAIPAVATTADDMLMEAKQQNKQLAAPIAMIDSLDLHKLAEAVDGIKGIRFIVANYNRKINVTEIIKQFEEGTAKIGKFTKVASDFGFVPGAFGFYAQENNVGYIGFMYDSKKHKLYAIRVAGFVDVPKLVEWMTRAAGTLNMQSPIPNGKPSNCNSTQSNSPPTPIPVTNQ